MERLGRLLTWRPRGGRRAPSAPAGTTSGARAMKMQRRRAVPAGITEDELRIRIFFLRVCPGVEHLTAGAFTCSRPLDYYLGDT